MQPAVNLLACEAASKQNVNSDEFRIMLRRSTAFKWIQTNLMLDVIEFVKLDFCCWKSDSEPGEAGAYSLCLVAS